MRELCKPSTSLLWSIEILSRIGQVAYQLALPPNLRVHNVFHIFVLKKYVHDATHVVNWNVYR